MASMKSTSSKLLLLPDVYDIAKKVGEEFQRIVGSSFETVIILQLTRQLTRGNCTSKVRAIIIADCMRIHINQCKLGTYKPVKRQYAHTIQCSRTHFHNNPYAFILL